MHYGILQVCFKERQDHANIPFFYFHRHADLVTGQGKGTRYAIAVPGWTPPAVEQARAAQPHRAAFTITPCFYFARLAGFTGEI